jgi:hypothetical protein
MTILDAFNDIEKLELKLLELYQYFNRLFSDDPTAAAIFENLSDGEKSQWEMMSLAYPYGVSILLPTTGR